MLDEKKIVNKIKNKNLEYFFQDFPKITGLVICFELINNRVRAENKYTHYSNKFIIRLSDEWKEVDLAHELMHGNIMFIENCGIICCDTYSDLCQLIREYIEDIIVHKKIFNEFKIIPFDKKYIQERKNWTKDLFNKRKIVDSYWDNKSLICNQLHKAFLYVQAWHFNKLIENNDLYNFLIAFRKSYGNSVETKLADNIIEIYGKNNNFEKKEDYDAALKDILTIDKINLLSQASIKHFKKINNKGFDLI